MKPFIYSLRSPLNGDTGQSGSTEERVFDPTQTSKTLGMYGFIKKKKSSKCWRGITHWVSAEEWTMGPDTLRINNIQGEKRETVHRSHVKNKNQGSI